MGRALRRSGARRPKRGGARLRRLLSRACSGSCVCFRGGRRRVYAVVLRQFVNCGLLVQGQSALSCHFAFGAEEPGMSARGLGASFGRSHRELQNVYVLDCPAIMVSLYQSHT
jgi:hypothetical protein